MRELAGKTAVITGAGSGIGRGTALALAEAGMNVVVSDINEASAATVADEVRALGVRSLPMQIDVADRPALDRLADAAWSEFGAVHLLHNNAGVVVFLPLKAHSDADWQFTVSVNLMGVVNGVQAFLPRLLEQGVDTHIVNTASIAGMTPETGTGAYSATKFAVVALSETLHSELADTPIRVSVVCPGIVMTNLVQTTLQRRPEGGADYEIPSFLAAAERPELLELMSPEDAGRIVRRGIEDDELYIFTHPQFATVARQRFDRILAAFDRAAQRATASNSSID